MYDMNKSLVTVSYLKLLLKEYGPANNCYFMGFIMVPFLISMLLKYYS